LAPRPVYRRTGVLRSRLGIEPPDALSRAAEEAGQYSAAARCEELIGRARGMFLDRSQNTLQWDGDLSQITTKQLEKMAPFFEANRRRGNCGEP